jgi:hypothetical protein
MWKLKEKTEEALVYENTNTGEQVRCGRIYTHNELGVFYAFDNILQMPFQRKFLFDLAQQMEKIGIEKEELIDRMGKIQELCKDKKEGFELDIYAIAKGVEQTAKDHWDFEKTALLVTTLVVIQEGESIGYFDQAQSVRKLDLWKKDKDMLGFFLSVVSNLCSPLSKSFGAFTQMSSPNQLPRKEN